MWLPKFVYEPLPLVYLLIGSAGLVAAFVVQESYWPEALAGGGLLFIVIGLMLMLRRKGYRASRSRLDFDRSR